MGLLEKCIHLGRRAWLVLEPYSRPPRTHLGVQGCICIEPVAPVAYQVNLDPGIGQFREFEPRRVHARINSLGLLFVHKLTCGKRESVSSQHSMKNRRAVGLLNPMRDKNRRQESGRRDDICDHGLSRSWKVEARVKIK